MWLQLLLVFIAFILLKNIKQKVILRKIEIIMYRG